MAFRKSLTDFQKRAKAFATKNKKQVIAVCAVAGVLVITVTALALSSGDGKTKRKPYPSASSSKTTTAMAPAKKANVASDAKPKLDPMQAGVRLYEQKNYKDAIDAFQPLVDDNVEARYWLGQAHLADGNDYRGCRQLRLYVEKAPKGRYVAPAKKKLEKC